MDNEDTGEGVEREEGREGRIKGGRRERVTNVGAGGEGVMKSRASYVGTSAQPCSTCEVTTPWMSTISCFTPPPPPSSFAA